MLFGQVALGALALATIIPALLVVWVGERLSLKTSPENVIRSRVLFLLFSTTAILLIFSINAQSFSTGDFPIHILVLFPTLIGLLALLLLRWHDLLKVWRTDKPLLSVLLVVIVVLIASLGRAREVIYIPLIILLTAALTAGAWELSRRSSLKILEMGAVLIASFLFLDSGGVIDGPTVMSNEWFRGAYLVVRIIFFILALSLLAALVYRTTKGVNNGAEVRSNPGLAVAVILLLAIIAVMVRKAVLVDATGRAAEDHLPFLEILYAILIGMMMVGVSQGRTQLSGVAFIILIPVLIIGAYGLGWLFEPQAITQVRAGRIAQAVEQYHHDNGVYPSSLEALTPQYMPFILGPLTGRGQVWCYQGNSETYRLGYVFFQRYYRGTFPEPYFEIKTYANSGVPHSEPWMCDDELERYKKYPGL
jgi:hypothetical protein